MKRSLQKIAFVCEYDIKNPNERSGVPYFIAKTLRELGHEIIQIGPFENKRSLLDRVGNAVRVIWFNKILKGRLGYVNNQWSEEFLSNYARQTEEKLASIECDFIISPESSTIAYLKTKKPIVFWRDATFNNLLDYYPGHIHLHPKTIAEGHRAVRNALGNCTLGIYTSQWAASTAIHFYGGNESRIRVIERGANLIETPSGIETLLKNKLNSTLKILFIGADWDRKGGNEVYDSVARLNAMGCPTELHIIGGTPTLSQPLPDWMHYHGFLKKTNPQHVLKLKELYSTCHLFAMLSHAENFGIVYAEASAYGIPSIARDTGGVSSAVKENENGFLFGIHATSEMIAQKIYQLWNDKPAYLQLSQNSRRAFETRLNWITNCERMLEELDEALQRAEQSKVATGI